MIDDTGQLAATINNKAAQEPCMLGGACIRLHCAQYSYSEEDFWYCGLEVQEDDPLAQYDSEGDRI